MILAQLLCYTMNEYSRDSAYSFRWRCVRMTQIPSFFSPQSGLFCWQQF